MHAFIDNMSKPSGIGHSITIVIGIQYYLERKVMLLFLLVACSIDVIGQSTGAQVPQVPHKMQFAGITLTIRDDARREIQKDVDALTQSPRHFMIKVERARTYFPIIEKIFEEERVPVDFKYLVLQESSLIADAVSPSNAVGFWQFKDFTAMEMGMRVDKQIDERMNIASSSRGAARYIKKNNFYFNNWIYALQSYQMGAGAVMKTVDNSESGAKHMEITSKTYWYVKKYLAHKVAFEDAVNGKAQLQVITFENKTKKSIADLAKEVSIEEALLRDYNKWIKAGVIPDDRTYAVLIPLTGSGEVKLPEGSLGNGNVLVAARPSPGLAAVAGGTAAKINGLHTVVALKGERTATIAARTGVELADFLKWNDMSENDSITAGEHYFLSKKRIRATEAFHKVLPGENLWSVSQKYGVQLKRLRKFNRLTSQETVKAGETLWLSSKRPKDAAKINTDVAVAEVDNGETFSWLADPVSQPSAVETVIEKPIHIEPELTKVPVPENVVKDTVRLPEPDPTPIAPQTITPESAPVELKKDSVFTITVKKTEHVVQKGETLYAIAHQYNVGVMDLVNWNNLDLQQGIKVGQVLKLSDNQYVEKNEAEISGQPTEIIHEVKMNDTLYSVARKYGVTIKELMDWNEKKDFSVSVGEKIKIIKP